MALVVFLKGINVGGHHRVRTSALAQALKAFDVVNIGAAGTFVVRKTVAQSTLRAAIAEQLPFPVDVMVCDGRDVLRLIDGGPFAGHATSPDIMPFVSVLARGAKPRNPLPLSLPSDEAWSLKLLKRDGPFLVGLYRREMKAIDYLAQLEKICGATLTTRNWNTMQKIGSVLRP